MMLSAIRLTLRPVLRLGGLAAIALALLLTASCAVPPRLEDAQLLAPVPEAELNRARALAAAGDSQAAAEIYVNLASAHRSPTREELLLRALQVYLESGHAEPARALIRTLADSAASPRALTNRQRQALQVAEAELALLEREPGLALERIRQARAAAPLATTSARLIGLRAAAQRLEGDPVGAARTLLELDGHLTDPTARVLTQSWIVATLAQADTAQLQPLLTRGGRLRMYAHLARLVHEYGNDPERWRREALALQPRPPAELVAAYTERLWGGYAQGERLVAMLPRGGRFAGAAVAVRGGIEAAHRLDRGGQRPDLHFVDSTESSSVRALHELAVRGRASHLIGPLQKEAVDALAAGPALPRPTLALNQVSRPMSVAANLFQFGLSPEDEAEEGARRARAFGCRAVLGLHAPEPWGERLAGAFAQQWQRLGGAPPSRVGLSTAEGEWDAALDGWLRPSMPDCVFLVATADQARRLYPPLRERLGPRRPVIATSHVYQGERDPARDTALAGLYFVDIPWMFDLGGEGPLARARLRRDGADLSSALVRLFAMGVDAYHIAARMEELASNPGAFHAGQSGGLSLDPNGRVQRQLMLGRFTPDGVTRADSLAPERRP